MYLTKLISITLTATVAIVAAAPSQLEERQSGVCGQVAAELSQASAYYANAVATWIGGPPVSFETELSNFNTAATSISNACQDMDQIITGASQNYQSTESQIANNWY